MRVAQYALPPAAGADVGEVAAYFFRPGKAVVMRRTSSAGFRSLPVRTASRWHRKSAPKISIDKNGETEVTLVELQGTYARGIGMGPTGDAKPDQILLIAIVETSIGRITLQNGRAKPYLPNVTVFSNSRRAFIWLNRYYLLPPPHVGQKQQFFMAFCKK